MSNRSTVGINYSIKLKFRAAGKHQGVQAGFVDDGRMLLSSHEVENHDPILLTLVFIVYMVGRLEPRTLKNLSPLEASSPVLVKTCVLLTG